MDYSTILNDVIVRRANIWISKAKPFLAGWENKRFIIAGNALNQVDDTDLDTFCFPGEHLPSPANMKLISQSKNATTWLANGLMLQVCKYSKPTLEELVNSFDFTHIQVGCEVSNFTVTKTYCTEGYIKYRLTSVSEWTGGTEYPLSSLIRILKYHKKDQMPKGVALRNMIAALTAVIRRGFSSYGDFKDQLDAVDLGLLPTELDEVGGSPLLEIYELLAHNKEGEKL